MRSKTFVATLLISGAVAAIAAGLAWHKYRTIRTAMSNTWPETVETVEIAEVEQTTFQRSFTAVGTVSAMRWVMLATEVAGKVVEVGFESGQVVDEKQLLVQMDTMMEEADLRAAEAAAELARVTLERLQSAASNAVAKQEIDRARAEELQGRARVEQLRSMIEKKQIKSSFRGRVGMRNVHPGQYLKEGQEIAMVQGLEEEVYVDFAVPQLQAMGLGVGSKVTVALGGNEMPAVVAAMDAQIDPATRNVKLRGKTSSLGGRLTPGMFIEVRVPLGEPATVVVVPQTSVRNAPFGDHVFVILPHPKDATKLQAHQRFVKLGTSVGGRVIVTEGLAVGEKVAADGSFKLREGALVAAGAAAK